MSRLTFDTQLLRFEIIKQNGGILSPDHAIRSLETSTMKQSLIDDQLALWRPLKVAAVVSVGVIATTQDLLAQISHVIAIGIPEPNKLARDSHDNAVFVKYESIRQLQIISEHRPLIGLSIAAGVFKNQHLIVRQSAGNRNWVAFKAHHPEATTRIEVDLQWIDKFWKLLTRSKEVHFITISHFKASEILFR